MQDHSKLELFNKHVNSQTQGTLVGNWWEERELRMTTNVGRTIYQQHIPKTREELFLSAPDDYKVKDPNPVINTADRVFCKRPYQEFNNTNATYGGTQNKAEVYAKHGQREKLMIKQQLKQVQEKIDQDLSDRQKQDNQRFFETSTGSEYVSKPLPEQVGRLIMRDQDNKNIVQQKDDPYYVELGRIQRQIYKLRPVLSNNINVDAQQHYATHKPATFYEEKKEQGIFHKSKGDTFQMNNDFIKSYHHYNHKLH